MSATEPAGAAARRSSGVQDAHASNLELLTVGQVAEWLQTSKWFVYDHGLDLGLVKIGGANRYRAEIVEAYVERRSAPTVERVPVGSRRRRSPRDRPRRVRLLESATDLRPDSEAA